MTILRETVLLQMGLRPALVPKCRYVEGLTKGITNDLLNLRKSRVSQIHGEAIGMLHPTLLAGDAA